MVVEWVSEAIKTHPVVVFSKTYCPYCHKAKEAIKSLNLPEGKVAIFELDERQDSEEVMDTLKELTGGRTVPRVFINNKFFGGGDDTVKAKKDGTLADLLKDI